MNLTISTIKKGVALAAMALALSASPSIADAPQRGGVLNAALSQEIRSLDPMAGDGGVLDQYIWRQVYEALVDFDDSGAVVPGLAESWTYADDGMSIDFVLREGVKFHDGTSFDAEAAAYNLNRALNEELNLPRASDLAGVESVEVLGAHLLRVNLEAPSAAMLPAIGYAGLMASPAAMELHGQDYGRNPVGTGPFRFVSWQSGSEIRLERNSDYWRTGPDGEVLPLLDGVVVRFVSNSAVKLIELKANGIHLVEGLDSQDISSAAQDANLQLVPSKIGMQLFFGFNIAQGPFESEELRKAVLYAIDREAIATLVGGEFGQVIPTVIPPASWAYSADVDPYVYDPERAKALLSEGGLDGFRVSMQIIQRQPDTLVAQLIQSQLAEVGIAMDIDVLDRQTMQAALGAKDFEMGMGRFTVPGVDPSQDFGRIFGREASIQRTGVSDEVLFDMIDAARLESDPDTRKLLYADVERYLLDNALYGFMLFLETPQVMRNEVENVRLNVGGAWDLSHAWLND